MIDRTKLARPSSLLAPFLAVGAVGALGCAPDAPPRSAAPPTAAVAAAAPSEPPIAYRTTTVDGLRIAYREAGPKDAPTILLLHGFPSSSHMFRDLIPFSPPTFISSRRTTRASVTATRRPSSTSSTRSIISPT